MRALLPLILSLAMTAANAAEEYLFHDGVERRYVVEGNSAHPAPAIVVLHGGGGGASRVKRFTKFTLADDGWLEIYPEGLDGYWNDGRRSLEGPPLRTADDLGFIRAMLARLIAEGRIDRDRIFFTGPSNGGAMTQRMLCQASDLVAGAAVVIMNFPVGLDCPDGPPIPLLFMLGTDDPLVPFGGGPVGKGRKDRGGVMPAPDTLAFYAGRNGCESAREIALSDRVPDDRTTATRLLYEGCAAQLTGYIIDGGGHTWPGRPVRPALRWLLGRSTQEISATEIIEDFFKDLSNRQ